MTDRELMQQALEALNHVNVQDRVQIITALRERLAQPEQEPFGYFQYDPRLDAWVQNREGRPGTPFYTAPPQRKPLTDEGIEEICWTEVDQRLRSFARGSEAKLKEKNA